MQPPTSPLGAAGTRCVALASDDAPAAAAWRAALAAEGLLLIDWPLAAAQAAPRAPDALLLHLAHGVTGQLGLLRDWAARWPALPIVVVCRALRDLDHVLALEMGADDVLDAGLDAAVAAARLRALWRRSERLVPGPAAPQELQVAGLVLRWRERCVLQAGRPVELTEGEFELLWRLALRAGQVVSRRDLLRELRGLVDAGPDRSIDSRVYRIRAKLGEPPRIRTIRNCGYLLAPLPEGASLPLTLDGSDGVAADPDRTPRKASPTMRMAASIASGSAPP